MNSDCADGLVVPQVTLTRVILHKLVWVVVLAVSCALLASCYVVPGTFAASLDIRRDGSFTYRYVGDIAYAYSGEQPAPAWQDSLAQCWDDQAAGQRACSQDEIDKQRSSHNNRLEMASVQSAQLATLMGFNPLDDYANRRIAADMMQSQGWKKVEYKGKGVFAVEYETSGTLERDFVFPVSPKALAVVPFLTVLRSKAGVVDISAPGFTSGVMRKIIFGNMALASDADTQYFDRINGTFELTSDAEMGYYTGNLASGGNAKNEMKIRWHIFAGEIDHSPQSAVEAQLELAM